MAFSWILGRRKKPIEDGVDDSSKSSGKPVEGQGDGFEDGAISLADIKLTIEKGLVMAFGPEGDPITPEILKEACARQPDASLRLPDGFDVNRQRLIDVIDAQQGGKLAEQPSDDWIKAMLGAEGGFEQASPACLQREISEGKSMLVGRLTLDMPGGEKITLCDAHPGNARHSVPAKLMIDDKPLSITEALQRSGTAEPDETSSSMQNPVLTRQGDVLTLCLGEKLQAQLEPAEATWEGEAKVDLFLSDGRQVSVDDLSSLLTDMSPAHTPSALRVSGAKYPLLGESEFSFDLEHATIVMVADMPDDWSLTTGTQSERGLWILDPSNLADTVVRIPATQEGSRSLTVKVISIVGHDGTLEKQTRTVVMPPKKRDADIEAESPSPAVGRQDEPSPLVPLALDEAERQLAGQADALLLRGVPKGACLSAGIFDPSVKGWVLKPDQLDRLVVRKLDPEVAAFEIELRSIHLDRDGRSRTEIIAMKTVAGATLPSSGEGGT